MRATSEPPRNPTLNGSSEGGRELTAGPPACRDMPNRGYEVPVRLP